MKITLFTKNNIRHNFLINLLSDVADELFVIQESETIFPGQIKGKYDVSPLTAKYFEKVNIAQLKLFSNTYINPKKSKIKILPIKLGDLNKCSLRFLADFLKSDLYIIFGSSYIKGELINFLIKQNAINIHMGVSPYYRGTDCNFWALFDNNPHLVGATIHLLSKGLDNGPILYHAMSNLRNNPFEYSMSTVKAAFHSIVDKLKTNKFFDISPIEQDKNKEIRYTKKEDFNEQIIEKYLNKNIDLSFTEFDKKLLKDPYIFNN